MANPEALTVTYLTPNTRIAYPAADVIDTSDEMVLAVGDMTQARLHLFYMQLDSDCSPQSVTIKAGDNPPAVRSALGDVVINLDAASAFYETALAGVNNDIRLTSVVGGEAGDDVSITLTDPGGTAALAVTVSGDDISVALETADGSIVTTADELIAAINDDDDAPALVVATRKADNDGTGVVTALTKKVLGTDGTAGAAVTYLVGPLETARFMNEDGEIVLDFIVNEDESGEIGVRVLEMPRAV